jgi:hypothetical protein
VSPRPQRTTFFSTSMAVAVSRTQRTPWRSVSAVYFVVINGSVANPPSTRFDIGHEMNSVLGSIIVTSIDGSSMRMYLAAVAPP